VKLPDVILLNGAPSAGKSSLTLALQAQLPFVRLGLDDFVYQCAPANWFGVPDGFFVREPRQEGIDTVDYGANALKVWRAYHRAVRACVAEGLGVIVDDAIITRELLDDWLTALNGVDVFFVGVHCAVEELILRNRARRDRRSGSEEKVIKRVHAHAIYDLEIDSTVTPSSVLAAQIIAALETCSRPSAFERLALMLGARTGSPLAGPQA
jgi:chloramphenicol 3-O phosphotransferase